MRPEMFTPAANIFPPAPHPTSVFSSPLILFSPSFLILNLISSHLSPFSPKRTSCSSHQNGGHQLPRPPEQPHEAGVALQAQHRDGACEELPPYLHHRYHWYVILSNHFTIPACGRKYPGQEYPADRQSITGPKTNSAEKINALRKGTAIHSDGVKLFRRGKLTRSQLVSTSFA